MNQIQGLLNAVLRLITASLIAFFLFLTMILINWKLTIVVGFAIGFSYLVIIYLCKERLSKNSYGISKRNDVQVKQIQEGLGSIREIILNHNHEIYIKSYQKNDIPLKIATVENKFLTLVPRFGIEGLILFLISMYTLFIKLFFRKLIK